MTGLRGRVLRLETSNTPTAKSGASERLVKKLARLEAAVMATGDVSDRSNASLMERTVRRYLRGDTDPATALRDLLAGRWP